MLPGLQNLIKRALDKIGGFRGSEYTLPIILALHGRIPEPVELKEAVERWSQINLTDETSPPREKEI